MASFFQYDQPANKTKSERAPLRDFAHMDVTDTSMTFSYSSTLICSHFSRKFQTASNSGLDMWIAVSGPPWVTSRAGWLRAIGPHRPLVDSGSISGWYDFRPVVHENLTSPTGYRYRRRTQDYFD